MRRGHHTSSVLRAMGAKESETVEGENQVLEPEEGAVVEPE
jgi:hypothetical protein